MTCPHFKKRDSSETNHDYFLTCDVSKIQKNQRLADFKLHLTSMKTPKKIISILHKGISSFYNESILTPSITISPLSTKQSIIGWNHLTHGIISKCFTVYMNNFYSANNTSTFSGNGWTKEVIKFIIIIFNSKLNTILSLEHQPLLITINSLCNKNS